MRWFGKKLGDAPATQVTVGPDGSVSFSGPDLSRAIAEILTRFQGHAPDEAVPALRAALKAHGHEVPDEWVTLIAQTVSKDGTTNLSFGNGSSTAP